jgi:hypothetical protein
MAWGVNVPLWGKESGHQTASVWGCILSSTEKRDRWVAKHDDYLGLILPILRIREQDVESVFQAFEYFLALELTPALADKLRFVNTKFTLAQACEMIGLPPTRKNKKRVKLALIFTGCRQNAQHYWYAPMPWEPGFKLFLDCLDRPFNRTPKSMKIV